MFYILLDMCMGSYMMGMYGDIVSPMYFYLSIPERMQKVVHLYMGVSMMAIERFAGTRRVPGMHILRATGLMCVLVSISFESAEINDITPREIGILFVHFLFSFYQFFKKHEKIDDYMDAIYICSRMFLIFQTAVVLSAKHMEYQTKIHQT